MKKISIILTLLALVFMGAVYAFVFDTDGGNNIWQQGTCIDNYGNHTDSCTSFSMDKKPVLMEWYPINGTNTSYCANTIVNCAYYHATCVNGACQPH